MVFNFFKKMMGKDKKLIKEGDEAFYSGNYSMALTKYNEAIMINKSNQEIVRDNIIKIQNIEQLIAKMHESVSEKQYDDAIKICEDILKINPLDYVIQRKINSIKDEAFNYHVKLGDGHFAKNRYNAALKNYKAALSFKTDSHIQNTVLKIKNILALRKAGDEAYQKGDFRTANAKYNKVLELNPYDVVCKEKIKKINKIDTLLQKANQYISFNDYYNAASTYKQILQIDTIKHIENLLSELNDKAFRYYINKGDKLYSNFLYKNALKSYNCAFQFKTDDDISDKMLKTNEILDIYNNGEELFKKCEYNNALNNFKKILELNPNDKNAEYIIKTIECIIKINNILYSDNTPFLNYHQSKEYLEISKEYFFKKMYKKSFKNAKKALESIFINVEELNRHVLSIQKKSEKFIKTYKYDKAIEEYSKILKIYESLCNSSVESSLPDKVKKQYWRYYEKYLFLKMLNYQNELTKTCKGQYEDHSKNLKEVLVKMSSLKEESKKFKLTQMDNKLSHEIKRLNNEIGKIKQIINLQNKASLLWSKCDYENLYNTYFEILKLDNNNEKIKNKLDKLYTLKTLKKQFDENLSNNNLKNALMIGNKILDHNPNDTITKNKVFEIVDNIFLEVSHFKKENLKPIMGIVCDYLEHLYTHGKYKKCFELSCAILDVLNENIVWKNVGMDNIREIHKYNNYIVYGGFEGHVFCVDISSKKLLWKFKAKSKITHLKSADELIIVGCKYGYTYAINIKTGKLEWTYGGEGTVKGIEYIDNKLYIGYKYGIVSLLNKEGKLIDNYYFEEDIGSINSDGDLLLVGCKYGYLYALKNDEIIWNFKCQLGILNIILKKDSDVAIILCNLGQYYVLNKKTGRLIWKSEDINNIRAIEINNDKMFVVYENGDIYSYYVKTGKLINNIQLNISISRARLFNNMLVIGCKYGYVYVLNSDCEIIGSYKFKGTVINIEPLNKSVVFTLGSNSIYYYNKNSLKSGVKNIRKVYEYGAISAKHLNLTEDESKLKYGVILFHLGKYEDAIKILSKLHNKKSMYYVALMYKMNGDYEKSIHYLTKLDCNEAIFLKQTIDYELSKNDESGLFGVENMKPDFYKIFDMGKDAFQNGDYDNAKRYFKYILENGKNLDKEILAHSQMGLVASYSKIAKKYDNSKEYNLAKENYEKVLYYIKKYSIPVEKEKIGKIKSKIKKYKSSNKFKLGSSAIVDDKVLKEITLPSEKGIAYDENGVSIKLIKKLGSGGEGAAYITSDGIVCKIYTKITKNKVEKLKLMVSNPIDYDGICWPKKLVYDKNRTIIGYLMNRAEGIELQKMVQVPKLLMDNFPHWKRIHLVRLCLAILDKIKYLHDKNIILGDINPLNLLVKDENTVYFIDIDSYQIGNYPCPVGTPEFTAPEIIGRDYKTFLRTFEHEYFAVAVLLFKILMLGKHPYSHIGGGNPIENIKKGTFPYGPGDKDEMPPGSWGYIWSHLTYKVKDNFCKAFKDGHKNPKIRPNVNDWIHVLEKYKNVLVYNINYWDKESNEIMPKSLKPIISKYLNIKDKHLDKIKKSYNNKIKSSWGLIDLDDKTIYILLSLNHVEYTKMDNKKLLEWAKKQEPSKKFYDDNNGIMVAVIINDDVKNALSQKQLNMKSRNTSNENTMISKLRKFLRR